jgi:DNA polymerase
VSDARERLRRYLEQRRELGESEYVLDSLSVEDAMRVLGTGAAMPAPPAAPAAPAASAPRAPVSAASAPVPPSAPSDSKIRRTAEDAAKSGDWRQALRAVDAAAPSPKSPFPPSANTGLDAPAGAPPSGRPIVVGAGAARSPLTTLDTIAAIARSIAACKACDLYATALNPVPGEGDPDAKFVVVGEAPGATEDELGRPFVGKSGDLLNKILGAIGFTREQVFICNVLKHRPPGNRNPSPGEIVACRPYLLRQLEILQPRVVLALGTFAAQTLLETDIPIGKLRGIEHTYHGIPLIATYHPAALLRNPSWKRPAWDDVQLARRIFDRA